MGNHNLSAAGKASNCGDLSLLIHSLRSKELRAFQLVAHMYREFTDDAHAVVPAKCVTFIPRYNSNYIHPWPPHVHATQGLTPSLPSTFTVYTACIGAVSSIIVEAMNTVTDCSNE